MTKEDFPLDLYLDSLVKFLDAIEYHDDNFSNTKRLETLQYVYSETAKHFARLNQQHLFKVDPRKLGIVMRTSVQLVVYCWVKIPREVMVAISIYFVHIVLLDDDNDDPHKDMERFSENLIDGNQQKHTFWLLMNSYLPKFLKHYGGFCGLAIFRSTLDYFQGCWIEQHNFQGFPGSDYYPGFLRRMVGLGGICGASLFPAEQFDEKAHFLEITTVIAQIEPMIALVNDMVSFFKEFENPRDQVSLVMNYCKVDGITLEEAFQRLTKETINCVERLKQIFDDGKTSEITEAIHAFIHGYVTWHFCDERFRMIEVYELASKSPYGDRFRQYYEKAVGVGGFAVREWGPTPLSIEGNLRCDLKTPKSSKESLTTADSSEGSQELRRGKKRGKKLRVWFCWE